MGKGGDRGRGRLQRGAFTWLRAGGGGCQAVAGLVVVIAEHTVLTPHLGWPASKWSFNLPVWEVKAATADQRSSLRINPGIYPKLSRHGC